MEFAMLAPEINSGRMYSGPGSGPMLAAAAAWDGLAADLGSAASSYESVITQLTGGWLGPASSAMAAAAAPSVAWMHTAALQAEQTATQAKSAAAAFETAFAMTVPPPVVAANRAQLAALVATNILGQNTAAIAATEAHYAEMWAQDAAAMYGYAGSSAVASALTPFSPPQQIANADGLAGQAAAIAQAAGTSAGTQTQTAISSLSAVPQALQSLASPAASIDPGLAMAAAGLASSLFGTFVIDSAGSFAIDTAGSFGIDLIGIGEIGEAEGLAPFAAGLSSAGAPAAASMGEAASVGGLSVPQSWTGAAPPAIRHVAMASPAASAEAAAAVTESEIPYAEMAAAGLAGRAMAGPVGRSRREHSQAPARSRVRPAHWSSGGPITSIAAELRELADLRDSGVLTDEEFTEQKRRLLG